MPARAPFEHQRLEQQALVPTLAKVTEAQAVEEALAKSSSELEMLTAIVSGLKIEDATETTRIIEGISTLFAQLNQVRSVLRNRRNDLAKTEGAAQFQAQLSLLSQSVLNYLEVDEAKLAQSLAEHPTAVKELFAIDTNGDLRIDNGYAHVAENFLEPYTRFTRGLISEQIKSNAERVKMLDKDIKRQEEHVKQYEAKLKTKFGYMESSVQKSKSTGTFLKQKLGGGDGR